MEWVFNKTRFAPGAVLPDGTTPADMLRAWEPWVVDCLRLMDGDGAYAHWYYDGALADQPWIDMEIYDIIRGAWVELMNKKMESDAKKQKLKTPTIRRR